MTVNIKFGAVVKDAPSLNIRDERHALAPYSPLLPQSVPADPYQVKFPLWFKQTQQQQALRSVDNLLNQLQNQWRKMNLPAGEIVWADKERLDNLEDNPNRQDLLHEVLRNSRDIAITWPQSQTRALSGAQNPEAPVALAPGNYELKLTVDDRAFAVNVGVSQNYGRVDANKDVLQKLAIAINSQQSMVKASLREEIKPSDPMRPYHLPGRGLQLLIEGQGHSFALDDVAGSLAQHYGLHRQSAHSEHTGLTAAIIGDRRLPLEGMAGLLQTTDGQIQVTSSPAALLKEVNAFLHSYNELVDYLQLQGDCLRPTLKDRLTRPQQDRSGRLNELGLTASGFGQLMAKNDFASHLIGDYKNTATFLLKGEKSWAEALMRQVGEVRRMGLENYANPLVAQSEEQARSRAWLDLEGLREKIVSAYC